MVPRRIAMPVERLERRADGRRRWRPRYACLGLTALALGPVAGGPAADSSPSISVLSKPLGACVGALGTTYGLSLRAHPGIAGQRVTLIGREASATTWIGGLEELLSVGASARVFWTGKTGDTRRTLCDSQARRALAATLADHDQRLYAGYLRERLRWAREEGRREFAAASPIRQQALGAALGPLLLLETLGPRGWEGVLAGEPGVGELASLLDGEDEPILRAFLSTRWPDLAGLQAREIQGYRFVFLRERHGTSPYAGGLTLAKVKPNGFSPSFGSVLRMPHSGPGFRLDRLAARPQEASPRRVTLNLTPQADVPGGAFVRRTLDQLLQHVAETLDVTVIADGYLRPPVELPANLEVRSCPLETLLTVLADTWECDWRYLGKRRDAVIVRARFWWLEDAADVPDGDIRALRERLGEPRSPQLADLLRLAELEEPQVRKLLSLNLVPAAGEFLYRGLHDGTGVRPCLRFFARLPRAQQQQAQTAAGLALAAADPRLVRQFLWGTLVARVGAVTEERRAVLLFSLTPLPSSQGGGGGGFRLSIRSREPGGCNWIKHLRPIVLAPGMAAPPF